MGSDESNHFEESVQLGLKEMFREGQGGFLLFSPRLFFVCLFLTCHNPWF